MWTVHQAVWPMGLICHLSWCRTTHMAGCHTASRPWAFIHRTSLYLQVSSWHILSSSPSLIAVRCIGLALIRNHLGLWFLWLVFPQEVQVWNRHTDLPATHRWTKWCPLDPATQAWCPACREACLAWWDWTSNTLWCISPSLACHRARYSGSNYRSDWWVSLHWQVKLLLIVK